MRIRHFTFATAILGVVFLLVASEGAARADIIVGLPTVSGPGGTGTAFYFTALPNNDNATVPVNFIFINETFTSVAPINATFTVAPSGGTTEYFLSNFAATNQTGVTWIDFHFRLIPTIAGDGLDFDTPNMDPTPTTASFATLVHQQDNIDWSGGAVPNGTSAFFNLSIDVPNGLGGGAFSLQAFPTVTIAAAVVPEPATLSQAGSGLLTLLGYGLWRRKPE